MTSRVACATVLSLCFIAGCTPVGSRPPTLNLNSSLFLPGGADLIPASDRISDDCLINSDFDTCLFMKNPFAQEQAKVDIGELDSRRRFGVKLRGLATSGHLENANVRIRTLNTPRLTLANVNQLKAGYSADTSYLEQLHAYYWLNRAHEYLTPRLGSDRVRGGNLNVYVDDSFTGYSVKGQSLHLEKASGRLPKALQAEIVIHLLGQALIHRLTDGRIFSKDPVQHNSCGLNPKGCCTFQAGCANALAAAFGDYVAAMMFPTQPKLGESLQDTMAGQSLCGQRRDLSQLGERRVTEVFTACAGRTGEITLMGSWYAALWWKVRTQAQTRDSEGALQVDRLFFDHAQAWSHTTNFAQAKTEALRLAQERDGGRHLALLQATFASAGL